MEPKWLEWAKELQAISQNGLTFSENEFDILRYERIREIAAEIMSAHSGTSSEFINDLFKKQDGYATPKVDVRGIVFLNDKVLLVKEKADGGWTPPGGWADPNETPSESVEREVFEESGFRVKAEKILAVYDRTKQGHTPPFPFHVYKIFFYCRLIGGKKTLSNETDGVDFFDVRNLPPLSLARVNEKQLKRFFEHHLNKEMPSEFD